VKIVYVGEMLPGATAAMRRDALLTLGHDVVTIDSAPRGGYTTIPRTIARRAKARLLDVPLLRLRVRALLLKAVDVVRPDMVYVDKGIFVEAAWLEEIRVRHRGVALVHFNPDDPFGPNEGARWSRFLEAIPQYDVHFVPRRQNVAEYESHGARRVFFQLPSRGYDPRIHHPFSFDGEDAKYFQSEVGFVGGLEQERTRSIRRLLDAGIPITLWGEGWARVVRDCPNAAIRPPVYGEDYGKAVAGSGMSVGFLRKSNRDGHTSRSIEIPACGSMLLAERTADHCELFDEGTEAEFFGSDEELVDKTRYYISHDGARGHISRTGRERCLRAGYDYASLMRDRLRIAMSCKTDL
jgi:spore maturation protein CgeB